MVTNTHMVYIMTHSNINYLIYQIYYCQPVNEFSVQQLISCDYNTSDSLE